VASLLTSLVELVADRHGLKLVSRRPPAATEAQITVPAGWRRPGHQRPTEPQLPNGGRGAAMAVAQEAVRRRLEVTGVASPGADVQLSASSTAPALTDL
jgi:hypothetical protein